MEIYSLVLLVKKLTDFSEKLYYTKGIVLKHDRMLQIDSSSCSIASECISSIRRLSDHVFSLSIGDYRLFACRTIGEIMK